MHLKQQAGIRTDGFNIILKVGAVGGTDFTQNGVAGFEDIRDAKAATDLYEFAAGNNDLLFGSGELPHDQHQRGGAIIGHHRRFRAAQFGEALLNVCGAFAAAPVVGRFQDWCIRH